MACLIFEIFFLVLKSHIANKDQKGKVFVENSTLSVILIKVRYAYF